MFPYFPCSHLIIEEAKGIFHSAQENAPSSSHKKTPDYLVQEDINTNDLRQAGTFDSRGYEMLIPIFPHPSMPFDESVYIDLISHIKRQTLMRVSSSSVNVIPWCDLSTHIFM